MHYPSLEDFKEKARQGNLVPVYREIIADLETPVSAFMKIDDNSNYSFLLESVEGGRHVAQYSFLGSNPSIVFRSKGARIEVTEDGHTERMACEDPFGYLRTLMRRYRPVPVHGVPRFFGGAVGYLGYEMVRFFEVLPDEKPDTLKLPDSYFVVTDKILIFDHVNHKIKVVFNAHVKGDVEETYRKAIEQIDATIDTLRRPLPQERTAGEDTGAVQELVSNFSKEGFCGAVEAAKEYIRAGDIFQVVLSQRLKTRVAVSPFNLYRALRSVNPSPYMFYLNFGNLKLIGSSPEMLVRVEGKSVVTRPLAGTRARGKDDVEDQELEEDLLSDEKERAEHVMLVDLHRNDIGRVCHSGSVRVTELLGVERYSHVMHIVSNVVGDLRAEADAFDALRAAFPAGTLSGAPKIRAMEIIEELEPEKRGPYGGVVGYFSFSGNLDTAIILRTIVMVDDVVYIQAGGGIVADSVPQNEYTETLNKAKALVKAVELAQRGLEL